MSYPWDLFFAIEVPVIITVIGIIRYVYKHPKL